MRRIEKKRVTKYNTKLIRKLSEKVKYARCCYVQGEEGIFISDTYCKELFDLLTRSFRYIGIRGRFERRANTQKVAYLYKFESKL